MRQFKLEDFCITQNFFYICGCNKHPDDSKRLPDWLANLNTTILEWCSSVVNRRNGMENSGKASRTNVALL